MQTANKKKLRKKLFVLKVSTDLCFCKRPIHTEIPSIFSSNPRFQLLKFTFYRHSETFEIPITELILIEIPKSRFKKWQLP